MTIRRCVLFLASMVWAVNASAVSLVRVFDDFSISQAAITLDSPNDSYAYLYSAPLVDSRLPFGGRTFYLVVDASVNPGDAAPTGTVRGEIADGKLLATFDQVRLGYVNILWPDFWSGSLPYDLTAGGTAIAVRIRVRSSLPLAGLEISSTAGYSALYFATHYFPNTNGSFIEVDLPFAAAYAYDPPFLSSPTTFHLFIRSFGTRDNPFPSGLVEIDSITLISNADADTTPPTISPIITGELGFNGWYTSPVTVAWNVVDDESPLSSVTGCESTTLTNDSAGTTLTCTATSAGGTASNAVTIKIDATPPVVTCSATPGVLWPPNRQLVDTSMTVHVADALSGPNGFTLVSVNGSDAAVESDMRGWTLGTPDVSGQLRAVRSGAGTGRIYTLGYRGMDAAGNSAQCNATVAVPKDQR